MPRKKKPRPYARIAITLPPDVLETADRLAARLDRSRSWVLAEAVRRFEEPAPLVPSPAVVRVAPAGYDISQSPGLGPLRAAQLESDLRLTPSERIRAAEESARLGRRSQHRRMNQLLSFDRPEDYLAWKRRQAVGE